MKINIKILQILAIFSSLVVTSILALQVFKVNYSSPITIISIVITSLAVSIAIYIVTRTVDEQLPISYPVAIIGFPNSGKTTLIASAYREILSGKILGSSFELKSSSTIERVNELIKKLDSGFAVGPTTDQDIFAFRTDIETSRLFITRTIKVEFGDFPGENSVDYINEYGPWLHTTPFFKWTASANAYVFIVDLGQYFLPRNKTSYIAEIKSAIRAAWQHLLDNSLVSPKSIRKHPIVLVFTKADLFGRLPLESGIELEKFDPQKLSDLISKEAFATTVPEDLNIDSKTLEIGKEMVLNDFMDLISYLNKETSSFNVIFSGAFGKYKNERLGIRELLSVILPPEIRIIKADTKNQNQEMVNLKYDRL